MNKPTSRLEQFIVWREQHVSDRQFTLLLSFAVGFFAAVAGFTLHWLIGKNRVVVDITIHRNVNKLALSCISCSGNIPDIAFREVHS